MTDVQKGTPRRARPIVAALLGVLALVSVIVVESGRSASGDPGAPLASAGPPGTGTGWHLVFADEFSGTSLDTKKWIPCLSAGWRVDQRQPSCPTWGTMQQTYRTANVTVGGGALHLTARREADGSISSGSVSTAEDAYGYNQPGYRPFGYRYGYFEARFRSADDSGMWPAVWEMPVGGGAMGEMDLFEIMSTRDDPERIKMTLHGDSPQIVVGQVTPRIPDIAQTMHVFGAEWTPTSLTFYVDGRPMRTIHGDIPDGAHFIQANLAIGGEFVPPVSPDQPYPQSLDIDYMRVYQRN